MADSVISVAGAVKYLERLAGVLADNIGLGPISRSPFFQKSFTAGVFNSPPTTATAVGVLSAPPTVIALGDTLTSQLQTQLTNPLAPILKSVATARADQGFCLRWSVPGVHNTAHDVIGSFHFGQYSLAILGSGMATLYEDTNLAAYLVDGTSAPNWKPRFSFRYCGSNQVTGLYHNLIIYPLLGPNGEKFINFASASLDTSAPSGSSALNATSNLDVGLYSGTETYFRWDEAKTGSTDQAGATNVTIAANFYLQERYDLRCHWQISKLGFWKTGTLIDQPWIGTFSHNKTDFQYTPVQKTTAGDGITAGYAITSFIADAVTRDISAPTVVSPYLSYVFNSWDSQDTPVLWGYRFTRPAITVLSNPGSFTAPYRALSLNGAAQDPRREGGNIVHSDPANNLPRLATRGELSALIATTAPTPDGAKTVKLFRGYGISPHRTKKGYNNRHQGAFGMGASAAFPSAEWGDYAVTLAGMWHRLSETNTRTVLSWETFALDGMASLNASGYQPPWKVTDAIKFLLQQAGFSTTMINIPDLAIRLLPGIGTGSSDQIIDPHTDIASMVTTLARNYLGRWLAFEPNAGTDGQWILVGAPPAGTVTPLWNFVDGPLSTGFGDSGTSVVLPHSSAAYPANTSGAIGNWQSYIVPPEYNHLWALCINSGYIIDNHIFNHLSYAVPGSTATLNPDSPHYVGRERFAVLCDPTLWAGAATGGYQQTQFFVNYVLHRFFYFACMPRQIITFTAPLAIVKDAAGIGLTGPSAGYRNLRFYDPVTWLASTGWYVRSVSPHSVSDRMQVATYELERVYPYLTT